MRSLNKVMLMGYLAADPEQKVTPAGKTITKFKVATNRDWTSSDGQKNSEADFHKVVLWQHLAEIAGKHLAKGSAVYLEGRLTNTSFKDKNGNDHHSTEIVGDDIKFLNFKKGKQGEEISLVEIPVK
jgi:single-strand DNA-binding protein